MTSCFSCFSGCFSTLRRQKRSAALDYVKLQEDSGSKHPGVKGVQEALGASSQLPIICVLGGTKFQNAISEPLIQALAAEFKKELSERVQVVTGGMNGVQEKFASGLDGFKPAVVHLMPQGEVPKYPHGAAIVLHAGKNLDERKDIFGQLGSIYLCIEGGPGVAKEATGAYERGAKVLPVKYTGGASGGQFNFPAGALDKPDFATVEQWEQLEKKCPADNMRGHTSATAKVIVQLIKRLI
mmetsp:Transcript_18687/g.29945  ORF Transcript_18687/g.29945 Transcript_18687/m.29945 type:complete len:240 (-) Transcript_18687:76-795(-)